MALTLDYAGALAALEALEGRGMKLGLERIEALLDVLGDPHRGLRGALVAGTNGKGSVCALLELDGARCGAAHGHAHQAPPDVVVRAHRASTDGRSRSSASPTWSPWSSTLRSACRRRSGSPTVFEVVTAAGIVAAREAAPDVLICEVGLGGRLDSTNVLDLGVAVVTGIALDHAAELGRDLAGIAAEKAAIIKPGNDVVTGARGRGARGDPHARPRGAGATSSTAYGRDMWWRCEDLGRAGVAVETGDPPCACAAPLIGGFQCRNLVVAAHTARALGRRGVAIPDAALVDGAARGALAGADAVDRGLPGAPRRRCHNTQAVTAMVAAAQPLCGDRCRRCLRRHGRQGPR